MNDHARLKKQRPTTLCSKLLWGVALKDAGILLVGLLSQDWAARCQPRYDGEPLAPLLFTTRREAEAWCREKHRVYRTYPPWRSPRRWRFAAVRVEQRILIAGRP